MSSDNSFVIVLGVNKEMSPYRVTLAFTAGIAAIEKGFQPTIALIMEGSHVGRQGYVDDIDIGEPFLCVKDLLEVYLDQGGEIVVCSPCLKFLGIPDEEIIPGLKRVRAGEVVMLLANAKGNLQLN